MKEKIRRKNEKSVRHEEENTKETFDNSKSSALFVTMWDTLQPNILKSLILELFLFKLRKQKKSCITLKTYLISQFKDKDWPNIGVMFSHTIVRKLSCYLCYHQF